jgi:hypothetical protein
MSMFRSMSAPVAVLGLMLLPVFVVSTTQAQVNGVPASVSSPGFGGRAVNGTPAGVTSLGQRGVVPRQGVQFQAPPPPRRDHNRDGEHHRRRSQVYYPYYGGVYGVPVTESYAEDSGMEAEDETDHQGGPTIFDRRGHGSEDYVPPVEDPALAHASLNTASAPEPPAPEEPETPTLLVFKDGRQVEIGNYAIVGQTLYDLTPGHARKIALADLDLEATQKQNDDQGVNFRLPPSPQAN